MGMQLVKQGLCSRVLHHTAQKFPSYVHWQSKVFWDISAFIFRVKQSKKKLIIFGLKTPEDGGTVAL